MHNVVKWPNILQKSCSVHAARFLKYFWPFYIIIHERVKDIIRLRTANYNITDKLENTADKLSISESENVKK